MHVRNLRTGTGTLGLSQMKVPMDGSQQDIVAQLRGLQKSEKLRDANEAKTRLAFINKVLEACGWDAESLPVEEPTGAGDYIDYMLGSDHNPWMVIEAKRASRTFAVAKGTTAYRSLASLSRQSSDLKSVLDQAARYCNDRGVPYACATNGYQWLFFRGLSAPGRQWLKGNALVFDSLDECALRISDFLRCLSKSNAYTPALPMLLERSSGAGSLPERRPIDMLPAIQRPSQQPSAATRAASEHLLSETFSDQRVGIRDADYLDTGHSVRVDHTLPRLRKTQSQPFGAI